MRGKTAVANGERSAELFREVVLPHLADALSLARWLTGNAHDAVDSLLEDALNDWEEVTAPLLDPLTAIIEKATSYEEALAMLEAAGPDGTKMAEKLARLTAISRGLGDVMD